MKYTIEIIEKMKTTIEINARSAEHALRIAENKYNNDTVHDFDLSGVEFVAILENGKKVKHG